MATTAGRAMKKYVFKLYSKIFPELFQKERERIVSNINLQLIIEHIGSTAVPGLGGKGIIDLAIAVDKENIESVSKQIQGIGYEFRPTFSTPDRLYFITYLADPEEENRRYHIHLTYPENKEWKEFLGFRDYLRSHPQVAQEYAELKKHAAFEANDEGEKYRKLKESIIKKINFEIDKIKSHPKVLIRQAKIEDANAIVEAERKIAKDPGYFCSLPSELSEQNVKKTIESSNGIYFVAECNGSIAGHAFLEILPLQSLKHIAQLNIAVHKEFQNCGIGTQLMEKIVEWAKESEFVEKIELNVRASNAQAISLYKKMGFLKEGCLRLRVKTRNGYIDDILMALHVKGPLPDRKISRTGVYGVAKEDGKIFLVIQKSGPYAGLFDLPGGGIEFGEDPICALHREFIEETGMGFRSMNQMDNFSAVTRVPALNGKPGYEFHQIGLIYSVEGLHDLEKKQKGSLKCDWVAIQTLKKDAVSPFVWAIIQASSP
jgi:GrpB-like predicted nucleotidyltransferase (UPF0157 family)/ribosomal protein S18 acetylase RimI-like enzyme/ADP-ribose pyrophosphatase YjhB (NUDIX family)